MPSLVFLSNFGLYTRELTVCGVVGQCSIINFVVVEIIFYYNDVITAIVIVMLYMYTLVILR